MKQELAKAKHIINTFNLSAPLDDSYNNTYEDSWDEGRGEQVPVCSKFILLQIYMFRCIG